MLPMFCFLLLIVIAVVLLLVKLKYDNEDTEFKGMLYHKHCRLSQFLLHKWTNVEQPFRPTFWAPNGHLQTLLHLLWPKCLVRWRREYLQLEDQGVIALDWISPESDYSLNSASPVLVIVPGLTCGTQEVAPLCRRANEFAFRCVVFNRRGHGGSVLTTTCLRNSCEGKDIDEVITYVHNSFPCAKIVAVAYSSGASLLLSYLEENRKSPLSGAVCISPSYEMDKPAMENGLPPIYDYIMTKRLVSLLRQHPGLSGVIEYDLALQSSNLHEFNENVYEPLSVLHDFRCTSENQLNNNFSNVARIRVPTLCISALDDPICSAEFIPYGLFKNSSNFFLLTCERGGHCGFYTGDGGVYSWADQMACTFLIAMIHFNLRKVTVENSGPSLFAQVTRDRSYTQ